MNAVKSEERITLSSLFSFILLPDTLGSELGGSHAGNLQKVSIEGGIVGVSQLLGDLGNGDTRTGTHLQLGFQDPLADDILV